ncbi:MAG: Holliday junction resolvase RuvX [bacterium]|nr:Holliday junction resolvase RuvX [bacterium]MCP4967891.1 Holliday junction resolvase RuvX [bacterium]
MILTRVLGLDPGERRIGVALSDPIGIIAQPHVVLDRKQGDVIAAIRDLCEEYEVKTVVVGLPTSLSGEEGPAAVKARELGTAVSAATGCDISFFDERFTTVQAESALIEGGMRRRQRRETIDKVAAAMMLQGYLDTRSNDDS